MNRKAPKKEGVEGPESWAVITGGASGLGLAIATELRRDCHLLLIDFDAAGLAKNRQHLAEAGHRVEVIAGDVANQETWTQARERLEGTVPLWLVQCAGIAVSGRVALAPIEYWRKAFEVNFLALVLGCKTFAGEMAQEGKGHIIHIASLAAFTGVPTLGPYAASKAAVVAMSETLYNEIGGRVSVTIVCPGFFRSNLLATSVANAATERRALDHMISRCRRSASDLAPAILRAARRGDLYYFPVGEDRLAWGLKRLWPWMALRVAREKHRKTLHKLQQ